MLQHRLRSQSSAVVRTMLQNRSCSHRINPVGIQMLPRRIVEKVFPKHKDDAIDPKVLSKIRDHLKSHDLQSVETVSIPEANFDVPELDGPSITAHFENVAKNYSQPYLDALTKLIDSDVPSIPSEFAFQAGWVRYSKDGKKFKAVVAPKGDAVVFDVETVVTEGGLPAMAVALTATHWYSWCSEALAQGRDHRVEQITPDVLIPISDSGGKKKHRVIIGHNVGFDRGYIKEQYSLESSNTRFLDTLSLHVSVSGQTSEQKIMTMSVKKKRAAFEERLKDAQMSDTTEKPAIDIKWMAVSSLNNLGDVHNLYCNRQLEKSARDTFVTGTSDDVRNDFQNLVKYCASDVLATRNVLCKLLPLFLERFPHPATLFGVLETLTVYLPVNDNWKQYLEQSKRVFDELDSEIQQFLNRVANETCNMMENDAYKSDPWLWDLDWSTQESKSKKSSENAVGTTNKHQARPKWFRDMCEKSSNEAPKASDWESGPWSTSFQKRSIPKLLKIMWKGYAVHYHNELGWGYLVPSMLGSDELFFGQQTIAVECYSKPNAADFPLESYLKLLEDHREMQPVDSDNSEHDELQEKSVDLGDFSNLDNDWKKVSQESEVFLSSSDIAKKRSSKNDLYYDIGLKGVKFRKLPQRPGSAYNVGSPLSRLMIEKYWGNKLSSWNHKDVVRLFDMAKNTSYWKTVRDRISEQVAVWTSENQGAILPRIMPAGTIYRKPFDRTWSATSRTAKDRIGSEFKAMVQAPEGFHFVGHPVDSIELWIAALLGDSEFAQMHGCTALGWRVIQGNLFPEVSLHRKTANIVGCTERQAKTLDLFRLHGAGQKLLCKLLLELVPSMDPEEAMLKTKHLMKMTKGERKWPETSHEPVNEVPIGAYRRSLVFEGGERFTQVKTWTNGSESHAFNRIERIASQSLPSLPFLAGRVSRALEPRFVFSKYAMSRVNWVIQSSAVDFQHLYMLSVRHLFDEFDIKGRLTLPTHDEIKFMVNSKHRYKAALALHISNLYVRSFFSECVGIDDLPYSVAFCPSVTVDKVLRRDVTDDCVTPSNPRGLRETYGIPPGESLDIHETLKLLGSSSSVRDTARLAK